MPAARSYSTAFCREPIRWSENQNDVSAIVGSSGAPLYTDGKETAGVAGATVNNERFGSEAAYNTIANIQIRRRTIASNGGTISGYLFGERSGPAHRHRLCRCQRQRYQGCGRGRHPEHPASRFPARTSRRARRLRPAVELRPRPPDAGGLFIFDGIPARHLQTGRDTRTTSI